MIDSTKSGALIKSLFSELSEISQEDFRLGKKNFEAIPKGSS